MLNKSRHPQKAQAATEMAVFGSLILFGFSLLLSYLQRFNDQQYVQMETFRRALERANTFESQTTDGIGASVDFILFQNRKHSDISGGFRKGQAESLSGSSSVFWALPEIGEAPDNLIALRVNEDDELIKYRDKIPLADDERLAFRTEPPETQSNLEFSENLVRAETPQTITTHNNSRLKETITTTIPTTIRERDDDEEPNNDVEISREEFVFTQGLYRDPADNQYKYSRSALGAEVNRSKTWSTNFKKNQEEDLNPDE